MIADLSPESQRKAYANLGERLFGANSMKKEDGKSFKAFKNFRKLIYMHFLKIHHQLRQTPF